MVDPFCILTVVWVHRPARVVHTSTTKTGGRGGDVEYNRLHVSLSVSWLDYSFCKMSPLRETE